MTVVSMDVSGAPVEGFLAVPDGGHGPGVLVVQEWWGLVPHIRSVVERLADGVNNRWFQPDVRLRRNDMARFLVMGTGVRQAVPEDVPDFPFVSGGLQPYFEAVLADGGALKDRDVVVTQTNVNGGAAALHHRRREGQGLDTRDLSHLLSPGLREGLGREVSLAARHQADLDVCKVTARLVTDHAHRVTGRNALSKLGVDPSARLLSTELGEGRLSRLDHPRLKRLGPLHRYADRQGRLSDDTITLDLRHKGEGDPAPPDPSEGQEQEHHAGRHREVSVAEQAPEEGRVRPPNESLQSTRAERSSVPERPDDRAKNHGEEAQQAVEERQDAALRPL